MNVADTPDCGEWSVYARGSVLITAKHLSQTINSSVLFEDIATTIDGGVNASAEMQATADHFGAAIETLSSVPASDPLSSLVVLRRAHCRRIGGGVSLNEQEIETASRRSGTEVSDGVCRQDLDFQDLDNNFLFPLTVS